MTRKQKSPTPAKQQVKNQGKEIPKRRDGSTRRSATSSTRPRAGQQLMQIPRTRRKRSYKASNQVRTAIGDWVIPEERPSASRVLPGQLVPTPYAT